jgi:hypothetical protein
MLDGTVAEFDGSHDLGTHLGLRSIEESDMHPFKLPALSCATVLVLVLSASDAFAGNDACKILPPEKFGEIMGYKATTVSGSGEAMCLYKGPGGGGGMLMIVTEEATPQIIAMAASEGTPHGNNGKLGASFSKGTVVFSVGITGTDPAKVFALAAEVKRNLK